jgi:hypothetical protein
MATSLEDRPASVGRALAPARAIHIWAAIGALFVALQLYIYGTWLISGPESISRYHNTHRASWVWAQIFQWGFLAISVVFTSFVVRRCVRERRLTTDAMIVIGMLSIWWQDPLYNYFRPAFFYNSNLINLESWLPHIPGVVMPYGNLLPEAMVWAFASYLAIFPICVILMCRVMAKCHERWPRLNGLELFGIAAVLGFVVDFAFEVPSIHTRIYAYPGAWAGLALWGHSPFQLPVLHFAEAAIFFAGCACVRYFRDDRGLTPVERGASDIANSRLRTGARLLAVVGIINVISIGYYPLVWLQTWHTDPFPSGLQPQQLNGLCGDQGQPYGPCPGPGVPWAVKPPGPILHPSQIYARFPYFQTPAGEAK